MKNPIVTVLLITAAFFVGTYTKYRNEAMAASRLTEWDRAPRSMRQYCIGAYVWMHSSSNGTFAQVWEEDGGRAFPMRCD